MGKHEVAELFNTDPAGSHLYTHLLREAAFGDRAVMTAGGIVNLKRGQLVFGIHAWALKTGLTEKVIRGRLKVLETVGEVVKQNCQKYSLISITSLMEGQDEGKQRASTGQAEGHITKKEQGTKKKEVKDKELAPSAKAPAARGTRWAGNVPGEWKAWAVQELGASAQAVELAASCFTDYWIGVPGAKGLKLDWFATWKNWARRDLAAKPGRAQGVSRDDARRERNIDAARAFAGDVEPETSIWGLQ